MKSAVFKKFLLLIFTALITACGSSSQEVKDEETTKILAPLNIIDKGSKSFFLDVETAVDYNSRFKVNVYDGKEFFSFANRNTSRIYEFDYKSGEATRKILLKKEGPNTVNLFFNIGIFFHSKDSIFVDSGGLGYYLINGIGEVTSKFGTTKDNSFDSDCCPVSFTNAAYYNKGKVYGLQRFSISDEADVSNYTFGRIDISDNAKTKKLLKLSAFVPEHEEIVAMELAKEPRVRAFRTPIYFENELLYAASPISDTVHVFRNFQLIDQFYVGKASVALADYRSFMLINQIQQIKNGVQNVSETDQPPHFGDVFVSPDGNIIYRVLIEATRGKAVETLDYEIPEIAKASLVVYDRTTQQLTTFYLPVEELEIPLSTQSRSVFVSSEGIHFETKEQVSEDSLVFRIFGME